MVGFPLVKLGVLAIKQISKPITKLIKQTAKSNQAFQTYIVTPPAQIYHWIGVRSKLRMLGIKAPKVIPPLNKSMAIETGSDLIGEMIVFTVGVTLILLEFSRQARNDRLKHDKHREQKKLLEAEVNLLNDRVMSQTNEIKNLKARLGQMNLSPF